MAGWAAVAQGATDMLNQVATAVQQKKAAERANKFTKKMMQHRHQWEVEDLKKAGLNPILSAGGTPSMGASAMAQVQPFNLSAEKAIDAFIKGGSAKSQVEKKKAEVISEYPLGALRSAQAREQVERQLLTAATVRETNARTALHRAQIPGALQEANIDRSEYGKFMRYMKRITEQIPPVGVGALIQRGASAKKIIRRKK